MRSPLTALILLLASASASSQQPGHGLTLLTNPKPAPDFTLTDLDGEPHSLSDYRGQVVIINFWATWCPPCRAEMPSMQRAWETIQPEGMAMLGINVGEDEDTIFAFTANYPVAFPLLMDEDSAAVAHWPVRGLPTTFIINPAGQVAYRAIGGREWDDADILAQLRALQNGRKPATE